MSIELKEAEMKIYPKILFVFTFLSVPFWSEGSESAPQSNFLRNLRTPTSRLEMANMCPTPLWTRITWDRDSNSTYDPKLPSAKVKKSGSDYFYRLDQGEQVSMNIPAKGIGSMRIAPIACPTTFTGDQSVCLLGDNYDPQPSISTSFEPSFGCGSSDPAVDCAKDAAGKNIPNTVYDVTMVDGFTYPIYVRAYQDATETSGSCSDINVGDLPIPPLLVNKSDPIYQDNLKKFQTMCVEPGGYSQPFNFSYLGKTGQINNSSGSAVVQYDPIASDMTPVIVNPKYFDAKNPIQSAIGCAAPGARLKIDREVEAQYTLDYQLNQKNGFFKNLSNANCQGNNCAINTDSRIIMYDCPFNADDFKSMDGGNVPNKYLTQWDRSTNGLSLANSPGKQLFDYFKQEFPKKFKR